MEFPVSRPPPAGMMNLLPPGMAQQQAPPPPPPHFWARLFTPEGRPYFFNPAQNLTSWNPPGDIVPPPAEPVAEKAVVMKKIPGTDWRVVVTNHGSHFYHNPATKTTTWHLPADLKEHLEQEKKKEAELAAQEVKRVLEERDDEQFHPTKRHRGDSPGLEESGDATQFMELLREKKISAFSTWENELPKIADDPRYVSIPSIKERKAAFELYCKNRVEEEKAEKKLMQENAKERFQQMLKDALKANTITYKTAYEDFYRKFRDDPRVKLLDPKEREALFKSSVSGLKDQEVEKRKVELEKAKKDFLQLLRETKEIDEYSRYDRIRKYIDHDKRYDAVKSSSLREDIFESYVKELSEEERARAKTKREESSIRDREREVRRDVERRSHEVKSGKGHYQKEEGTRVFQSMLVDFARNSEVQYEEVEKKMRNDSRWDQCSSLGKMDMEDLFEQHVAGLFEKVKKAFFAAVDSFISDDLSATWETVMRDHPEIRDDPRFLRLSSHPEIRQKEAPILFAHHMRERVSRARQEYDELLRENKFISYQVSAETRGQPVKIKEIIAAIETEKRYKMLDFMAEERQQLLERHIEGLKVKLQTEADKRSKIEQGVLKDH